MSTPHAPGCTCPDCVALNGTTVQVADWQAIHGQHLHRRGGEDFEREPYSMAVGVEWIVCPCCARLLAAKGAGL